MRLALVKLTGFIKIINRNNFAGISIAGLAADGRSMEVKLACYGLIDKHIDGSEAQHRYATTFN